MLGGLKCYFLRVAACLYAWLALLGHMGGLKGFARSLAGLNCPIRLRISLLYSFTGFAVWQNLQTKNYLYFGHVIGLERKMFHMPG
jgi:hypothetical protein